MDTKTQPFRGSGPADRYAAFEHIAASPEARALVQRVHADVLAHEQLTGARDRARRQVDAQGFRDCIERLIANLVVAKADARCTGWIGRSMKRDAFSGDVVSFRSMEAATKALKALGLIEHQRGTPHYGPGWDGGTMQKIGQPARFTATATLLALADEYGVKLGTVAKHFRIVRNAIEARTSSRRWGDDSRDAGKRVRLPPTPHSQALAAQVDKLNGLMSSLSLEGGSHSSFYRMFNNCDDLSSYRWNEGGRMYSQTEDGLPSYQTLPSESRARMRIGTEDVAEVDLTACHLTILHSLIGQPLDLRAGSDPYAIMGIDRELVKAWVTVSLGAGKPCERWPKSVSRRYLEKHGQRPSAVYSAREVKTAVEAIYPALGVKRYGTSWALLQFIESEVIIKAMWFLMLEEVPSYPVHDSLIVPQRKASLAAYALCMSFRATVGVVPLVKTNNQNVGAEVLEARERVYRESKVPEGAYEALEQLREGNSDDDYDL